MDITAKDSAYVYPYTYTGCKFVDPFCSYYCIRFTQLSQTVQNCRPYNWFRL